jgi:hypothetical protein
MMAAFGRRLFLNWLHPQASANAFHRFRESLFRIGTAGYLRLDVALRLTDGMPPVVAISWLSGNR